MSGLKLAALFGYFPHKFGFCGIQKTPAKKALLSYLSGEKISKKKIKKVLKTFKGAFAYYKLIARANKIKDPFNRKVVEAYWVGNKLLDKVPVEKMKRMIMEEFNGPGFISKKILEKKVEKIPLESKPHHSFHVFALGSVTGSVKLEDMLMDFCRVGWGEVVNSNFGELVPGRKKVIIKCRPLIEKNKKFRLGKPVNRTVFWNKKIIEKIKKGDQVAIHWNNIIKVLSGRELENLKKYTRITINSLNANN